MSRVLPAEWEEHAATIVAWPTREAVWGTQLEAAEAEYAALVNAIAEDERVLLVCRSDDQTRVKQRCSTENVEILTHQIDDGWIRDNGPLFVKTQSPAPSVRAVVFGFNSWGERFAPTAGDLTVRCAIADALGIPVENATHAAVLEGGALSSNGGGTIMLAAECVLTTSRNPDMTREAFDAVLRERLGANEILWIPHGLVEDLPNTDGHVDNVAVFVAPGNVLVQGVNAENPNYARLARNVEALRGAHTATGPLGVTECEVLPYAELANGERQPVPYINFALTNTSVLLPTAGDIEADEYASAFFARIFPSRRVRFVPAVAMAYGGGGPHCVTMQVPK
jgi:agmatine deiminase